MCVPFLREVDVFFFLSFMHFLTENNMLQQGEGIWPTAPAFHWLVELFAYYSTRMR